MAITNIISLLFCLGCNISLGRAQIWLHNDYECLDGSDTAVLEFFADANSQQNGWTMVCDGETVWDVPVGSLTQGAGSWISESSCVSKESLCYFTFLDANDDVLAGDGFIALRYGATTIAVAKRGDDAAFAKLTSCFGPGCVDKPLEDTQEEDDDTMTEGFDEPKFDEKNKKCKQDEEEVIFEMLLDDSPKEYGWSLTCEGKIMFERMPGSIGNAPGSWITDTTCVPSTMTCTFVITDIEGDGIGTEGFYTLHHGATTLAASDFGSVIPFTSSIFCFGPDCSELPLERDEDVTDVNESDNIYNDTVSTSASVNIPNNVKDALGIQEEPGKKTTGIIVGSVVGISALSFVLVSYLCLHKKKHKQAVTQDRNKYPQEGNQDWTESKASDTIDTTSTV